MININFYSDEPILRDIALEYGAVTLIRKAMTDTPVDDTLLRNGAWALSSFCRGKPYPKGFLV